jgi:hypothetical protein
MSVRPYTGTSDGIAKGKRAGTEAFIYAIQEASDGGFWVNGSFGVRMIRGSATRISVHSTGRAADISRRKYRNHRGESRANMVTLLDWLTSVADDIGLEYLADYEHQPAGRGWKCSREDHWRDYQKGLIKGGGTGDWIHLELDPQHASDPSWVSGVMASFPKFTDTPAPAPEPVEDDDAYPGTVTKRGTRASARVRKIQERLADLGYKNSSGTRPLVADGDFGAATLNAVKEFQSDSGLVVDGIVGANTWKALFG